VDQIHRISCLLAVTLPRVAAALVLTTLGFALPALAQNLQPVPELKTRVTDLTGSLSAQDNAALTSQLAAIEQMKGSQVAILIVPTTAPEDIFDYSIRVVEKWKLGRGKVDGKMVGDGVLILVAKNDRKVRIEVGRGLEGAIPDSRAKRIITESISPRFKSGDFAGGLQAGVDDIGKLIAGEALPEPWKAPTKSPIGGAGEDSDFGGLGYGVLMAIFGSLFARLLFGRVLGSIAAGVGTGFLINLVSGVMPLAIVAGVLSFLAMLIFVGNGSRGSSRVGPRTYGHGPVILPGGWGSGGGFGGGGGGDSGGFSGGGGDFGGGGSSGDW
jgi:uncharacterized protein